MAAARRRDAGLRAVGQSTQVLPSPAVPSLTPSCPKLSPCIPPGLCCAWGATVSSLVSPSVVPTPSPSLFWLQGAALLSEHPAAAREPGQQHPPAMAGPRALKFGAAPRREGSPLLSGSQGLWAQPASRLGFVPAAISSQPRGCSQPGAGISLQGQGTRCPCSQPTRILLHIPPGTAGKPSEQVLDRESWLCTGVEATHSCCGAERAGKPQPQDYWGGFQGLFPWDGEGSWQGINKPSMSSPFLLVLICCISIPGRCLQPCQHTRAAQPGAGRASPPLLMAPCSSAIPRAGAATESSS